MCGLHIRQNYFATRHSRFHPSDSSLYFLNTAQSCLRLADLLYPPAFFVRPPGIPAAHFRFASCQLMEAAVFPRLLFSHFWIPATWTWTWNFGACLRTSNDPWFTETSPIWLLFLLSAVTKSQTRQASGVNSAAFSSGKRCSRPFPTYSILFEAHAN